MNNYKNRKTVPQQSIGRKTSIVIDAIRSRIISGDLKPGEELPIRTKLLESLNVSNETLQRAVNILLADGFLTASRGVGTKVSNTPPNLSSFAVVVPEKISGFESLLWKTIRQAATRLNLGPDQTLQMYQGGLSALNADDHRLIDDVVNHRVCGILFTTNHARFHNTPALLTPNLPRVVWSGAPDENHNIIPATMWFDYDSLIRKAVRLFAENNRKRIAVIAAGATVSPQESFLLEQLMNIGAVCHTRWRLNIHVQKSPAARNIMQLLMYKGQDTLPNGLLILDDNLESDVCQGLISAGTRVPEDLFVVSHANFPTITPPPLLPFTRIGFDIEAMLKTSLNLLVRLRNGETVPNMQKMTVL